MTAHPRQLVHRRKIEADSKMEAGAAQIRAAALDVAQRAYARALADEAAFPADAIADLHRSGLLTGVLSPQDGGLGLLLPENAARLADVLLRIGWGSLVLGRLYEGHVNAFKLIATYASRAQQRVFAEDARAGHLFAVWNTEQSDGLRLMQRGDGFELRGGKILASGAGFVTRPLVTARDANDALLMVIPSLARDSRADLSQWTPLGMKASATGTVDFTGLRVDAEAIIGGPGDFHAQPIFSAGAWRFAAVHAGGIARVFDICRAHLVAQSRHEDPHQKARMGEAAIAVETARLWIMKAAEYADDPTLDAKSRIAYVDMARLAVERAGLDVMELAQRSVGLAGFMSTHPLNPICRDLATYLRQPAPDRALTEAASILLADERSMVERWS